MNHIIKLVQLFQIFFTSNNSSLWAKGTSLKVIQCIKKMQTIAINHWCSWNMTKFKINLYECCVSLLYWVAYSTYSLLYAHQVSYVSWMGSSALRRVGNQSRLQENRISTCSSNIKCVITFVNWITQNEELLNKCYLTESTPDF